VLTPCEQVYQALPQWSKNIVTGYRMSGSSVKMLGRVTAGCQHRGAEYLHL
jgi:hypothetical protein